MRPRTLLAASIALLFAMDADAATDARAVLSANMAATGVRSDDRTVLQTESQLSGQGREGFDLSVVDRKDGRSVSNDTLGPTTQAQGYDGTKAWEQDSSGAVTIESGADALPLAINNAYRNANLWWGPDFGGATVVLDPGKTEAGATYDVVTVTPKNGKPFDAWFDATTHLLARTIEKQGSQTVTVMLSDYRKLDGVQIPYKVTVDTGNGANDLQTATLLKAEFTAMQPDSVYAPPKVTVTDFSLPPKTYETRFPFKLYNNHIYAEVIINGHAPLQFILDTGGHNLLTRETAAELGVKVEAAMPGSGAGNGARNVGQTKVDALGVGDATFKHQLFGVLDFMPQNVEGTDVDGMIGSEVFKHFVTTIDYGTRHITLMESNAFTPIDLGTPIKFVLDGELPTVEGTFEGIPAKFHIDTGAPDELALTGSFVESNGLRAKHPKGVEAVDGWGVGGAARGYVTRASEITIGPLTFPNVVTSWSLQQKGTVSDASYQGNLGSGFLKRFRVTFDYPSQTMYLRNIDGRTPDDIGTYDRAGMWVNAVKDGAEVMDVTANGPAQTAGIKVGDIITAVEGHPISTVPLYVMRRNLRDMKEGTVVTFTIKQGAGTHDVKVSLHDQI
jgi:predicted aspartyl protease